MNLWNTDTLLDGNDDILLDSSCNPDTNFFKNNIRNLGTTYLFPDQFHNFLVNSILVIGFWFFT